MRLKPTNDFMVIETYQDISESLVLPEKIRGELFRVIDIGPGYITSQGKRLKPEIKKGDIVALIGNISTVPFDGERYQIARSGDVIAYYRPDKQNKVIRLINRIAKFQQEKVSEIGIPDKI